MRAYNYLADNLNNTHIYLPTFLLILNTNIMLYAILLTMFINMFVISHVVSVDKSPAENKNILIFSFLAEHNCIANTVFKIVGKLLLQSRERRRTTTKNYVCQLGDLF